MDSLVCIPLSRIWTPYIVYLKISLHLTNHSSKGGDWPPRLQVDAWFSGGTYYNSLLGRRLGATQVASYLHLQRAVDVYPLRSERFDSYTVSIYMVETALNHQFYADLVFTGPQARSARQMTSPTASPK